MKLKYQRGRDGVIRPQRLVEELDRLLARHPCPGNRALKICLDLAIYYAESEHWEAHEDCLSRDERSYIAHSGIGAIVRPVTPQWKIGDQLEVASNLTIRIEAIRWRRGACRTSYVLRDFRPRRMKRVPSAFEPPQLDEHGMPIAHTKSAIEEARRDGSYTASSALAVPDSEEEMDDTLYNRIHGEAAAANAIKRERGRVRTDKMRLEMRLAEARRKNWRSTVRSLERRIRSADRQEKKAA